MPVRMKRLNIQLPAKLKTQLDALRKEGTSASWFIRNLLEKEFQRREERRS